ncbi:MAG: hypothetical protein JXA30_11815 [Deltaproteobacteria bacterium]|nr:hypothetical protein [Deltaproteobacteria bacterium]
MHIKSNGLFSFVLRAFIGVFVRSALLLPLLVAGCGGQKENQVADQAPSVKESSDNSGKNRSAGDDYDNSRENFSLAPLPKNAITGDDKNGDHIRDDVEAFIDKSYKDKEWTRLAVRQAARAIQHQLVWADNEDKATSATADKMRAAECLSLSTDKDHEIIAEILAQTINTEARLEAYFKLHGSISGGYFELASDFRKSCAFDTEGLKP